ncbi:MAG: hypothetical protein IKH12_06900 [Clostridia bacterium]|nr:hypothetical protein [Clostridia bacterium]
MKHVKQTLAILLTVLMIVTAVPFAAFGAGNDHTHNFIDQDHAAKYLKSEATCSAKAVYYLSCQTCHISAKGIDESKTFEYGEKNATNHPTDKIEVTKAAQDPTCMSSGWTEEKTCKACNKVVVASTLIASDPNAHKSADGKTADCTHSIVCAACGQTIAVNPDNHPADKIKVIKKGKAATCGEAGVNDILYCSACEKTIQEDTAIPATGNHTGGTATCVEQATCTVCGQKYGTVDANNHDFEKVVAVAPSCTEAGNIEHWKCKREGCGKLFVEENGQKKETTAEAVKVNADGTTHKSLKRIAAKAATCSATGNIEYWHCDDCGYYYSDAAATQKIDQSATVIAKKDHTWGKLTLVSGNCTNGGTAEHECSVCHFKETVTIVAGKHPDEAKKTTKGKAATCTEKGTSDEIVCELCGTVIQPSTEVAALGHNYENGKATGKNDGTHTIACVRCGAAGDPIPCTDENKDCKCDVCKQQLAHVFTNYVPDNNATCAADGTKTAVCDVCGKAKDTVTDEGSKDSAQHQYDWTDLKDATCIANGHRKGVCKVCGAEVMEEISDTALGHVDSDWQYPEGFDCEVGGNRIRRCTRCGDITATEPIEGRAHTPVIDPEVTKTCTVDGKTAGSHCDICGKILTPQIIFPAEGHKANENGFTVTKKATCTEAGEQTAVCGVCGETFTETIPATGHSYVDTVVPPTCEGAGYTLHKCKTCGDQFKENITSATGHKMVQKIRPATTDENGKVVLTCSVCGKKQAYKVYRIKKITLSQTTFARDSKAHKPSVTITDAKGNKLTKNVDYKLKFSSGRKKIGTYKVVITFMGEYSGKVTRRFKIVPPVVKGVKAVAGKGSAKLTWTQNKYADIYVVYCATAKDGKYKKLGSTTNLTYTAAKLTSGQTYYFKVAAVRRLDSGNYYSADFSIKKATIQ